MKAQLIPLAEGGLWDHALSGIPHAFAHRNDACAAFARSSQLPTVLFAAEFNGARIVCPLSMRDFEGEIDIVTPYGFGGFAADRPAPGFAAAWEAFAAGQGWVCGYLQGNPLFIDPLAEAPGVAATDLFILDLSLGDDALLAAMSQSRRRQLRQSGAFDIGPAGPQAADFLVREAPAFFADRHASSLYQFNAETWRSLVASNAVLALEARRDGVPVAVTLFGRSGRFADYLFNVSTREGQDASAALLWAGARRLREDGATLLNLGGGIRPGDEVAEFKRRFGAIAAPMTVRKQIYRADAFKRLCASVGVSPNADYFPPYHATRA